MKTGLTLGKFSPFHSGHHELIETALSEMDHVIVVIYNSPETTSIPLQIRANWIRVIYPQVEVLEAWDGPTEIGDSDSIKKAHEQYLCKLLHGRTITAFYTAEFYGEHISLALNAENRTTDRSKINISGTIIRKDPFKNRAYLHPVVYKDHILNIVFVGAPSTGKTSLCREMARRNNTVWMPEYGREYWEQNHQNKRLTKDQLLDIAVVHRQKEEALLSDANRFLFVDTNAITTYMFGQYYHGEVHDTLKSLAEDAEKRYDLYILCRDDIPYDDTWDRSGVVNRTWFQFQIESDLKVRRVPYVTVSGTLNERSDKIQNIIMNLNKYDSITNVITGDK